MADPELTRRQVLLLSALAAASFVPVVNTLAASSSSTVDVGEITQYAKQGIYSEFRPQGFFIIRSGNRVVAQSALCTHKRSRLSATDNGFVCKAHNSAFAMDGHVIRSPAKDPLSRLGISLVEGRLIVDSSKTFASAKFDSPGAFVEAPAA